MIKNFKPRLYQETIFNSSLTKNTLIVLPTGLGKTNIFLMITAKRLKQYPKSKILLLGPTRPLIEQYYNSFIENFEINKQKLAVITGLIKTEKRKDIYKESQIIFSTPQCIENDIITNKINIKDFSLIGFDEAHRAIGDYAYCYIANKYNDTATYPRIIAMTASPGSDKEKIDEIIQNLNIENIEVKTDQDKDVIPYIQKTKIEFIEVNLDQEFIIIKKLLENIIKDRNKILKSYKVITDLHPQSSKTDILKVQSQLQGKIASGEKDFESLKSISILAEIMKIHHAIELIESQGGSALLSYMQNIFSDANKTKSKAVQNIVQNIDFKTAFIKTRSLCEKNIHHPKFIKLKDILKDDKKSIIFTQYRDTARSIKDYIEKNNLSKAEIFVGQAKKNGTGISQKKQKEMIEDFKNDNFKTLIATSVAEEGLDIPKVDEVIFFEPIPSAIRQIQRRGRTGRQSSGSVKILVTKNTRDEAYRWSAKHKETRMYKILKEFQTKFNPSKTKTLDSFTKQNNIEKQENLNIKIIVDHREKSNKIVKLLNEKGIDIELESLDIGDYLLSDRVCVEFKTNKDLIDSMIDGRFLSQLKQLRKYDKPIILVEGTQDIYSLRNINPNSIRGMLTTCMINYQIPIIFTKDNNESAEILKTITIKEQINEKRSISLHHLKPKTISELQKYIVSSFPGVGTTLSKPLLKRFRSIKNIINAKEEDLKKVDLIGEKKAKTLKEIFDKEFDELN